MSSGTFEGTRHLLRLAARRDRVALPVWLVVLVGLCWAQVSALDGVYRTAQDRVAYATTSASSAAARLFGSVDGASAGSIAMVEIFVFLAIAIAIMNSLLVVRHTRQNEERGRIELVRSAVVGRHASLAATLLLAGAVNAVLAVLLVAALVGGGGLPLTGATMLAFALAGVGATFAGIAAVLAQVSPSSRMANGLVMTTLAVAFAVRAVGDVTGRVSADGMHVEIAWPSWLSPIGWGQLAYPFGEQRWLALVPYVVVPVLLGVLAVGLETHRDVGRGLLRERRLRPTASRWLAGPVGLSARLNRGAILAWSAGLVATGAIGGAFTSEVETMISGNEQALAVFEIAGGSDVLVDAYQSIMLSYIGLFTAAFALQVALRARAEERGAGESLLVAGASRIRWMGSHLLVAAVASTVVLALSGVAMRLLTRSDDGVHADGVVSGALAYAPGVLVFVGAVALGFGISSRLAPLFGGGLFAVAVFVQIGTMFELPDLILKTSPITHVPLVPVDGMSWSPLLVLGAVAVVATGVGLAAFRRRDVDVGA